MKIKRVEHIGIAVTDFGKMTSLFRDALGLNLDYIEELPDGDYPANATTLGETLCPDNFEAYVGTPYLESSLFVTQLYPTQTTWDSGDRQIVCLIVEENGGQLTGSAKDSGL